MRGTRLRALDFVGWCSETSGFFATLSLHSARLTDSSHAAWGTMDREVRPTLIADVRQLPASSGALLSARRWSVSLRLGAPLPSGALAVIMTRLARCAGTIEHLRLSDLTDAGALALHRALSRARGTVSVLDADFSDSRALSDAGAGALAACVAEGLFRRSLSLARCERVGQFGVFALAAALPLGTLAALDVSGCAGAGGAGACALAAALSSAPSLETLVLADTDVGEEGVLALAAALAHSAHVRLRVLDISRGRVGAAGVRALASALAVGASFLERLIMDDSDVGDAGAAALAAALAVRCRRVGVVRSRSSASASAFAAASQLLPLSMSMRGGGVCDAGATDFAGIFRLKVSGSVAVSSSGSGATRACALGDIDIADARTPLSASVALTLIASARRVGARAIVSAGVLSGDAAAALSSPFGIALSLGGGGGGSDFNNGLTGAARVRVLQESWTGEEGDFSPPYLLPPSAAALKDSAAAAVRAGARAQVLGRDLERGSGGGGGGRGGGGGGGGGGHPTDVDHGLIASLVRARSAPPRVSVDLASLSSSPADALVECSDEDDEEEDEDVGSEDGSSGKGDRAGGGAESVVAAGGRQTSASGGRGGAVSPVSENLAAMLPSALLATPLDALTKEQLDAVLALARTLQKEDLLSSAVPPAVTVPAVSSSSAVNSGRSAVNSSSAVVIGRSAVNIPAVNNSSAGKSGKGLRSPLLAPPPLPTAPVSLALPPPPTRSSRSPTHMLPQPMLPPPSTISPLKRHLSAMGASAVPAASAGMQFVGGSSSSSLAAAPRPPSGAQSPLPLPRRSTIGRSRGAVAAADAASAVASLAQPPPQLLPLKTEPVAFAPVTKSAVKSALGGAGMGYAAIAAAAAARSSPNAGGSYARSFSAATAALPVSPPPSSAESSRPTSPDAWLYGGGLLNITSES